jgi:ubiquinone/menaquinone biosynthesis C-methylase UbiE
MEEERHVCPPWAVKWFDNVFRPLVHSPRKLFGPYVREGMTVLDVGCGAGWATLGLARLVGGTGRVIAADLQPEMLAMLEARAKRAGLGDRIRLHVTAVDRVGLTEKVGFALAFWMVHETPDAAAFLAEMHATLFPRGHLFVAEPKGHVTREAFETMVEQAKENGFEVVARPRAWFSRAAVLRRRSTATP